MKQALIAMIAHEANRAYCKSIGDDSQPSWDEAPDWQKDSAINGVAYHASNPTSKPSDSHNSWLAEKAANGWVYGPVKDAELREHPCMVPYAELPRDQQIKDKLFIAICRTLVPPEVEDQCLPKNQTM